MQFMHAHIIARDQNGIVLIIGTDILISWYIDIGAQNAERRFGIVIDGRLWCESTDADLMVSSRRSSRPALMMCWRWSVKLRKMIFPSIFRQKGGIIYEQLSMKGFPCELGCSSIVNLICVLDLKAELETYKWIVSEWLDRILCKVTCSEPVLRSTDIVCIALQMSEVPGSRLNQTFATIPIEHHKLQVRNVDSFENFSPLLHEAATKICEGQPLEHRGRDTSYPVEASLLQAWSALRHPY